jgi:acetolactate synthase-1/2/3 large subunit
MLACKVPRRGEREAASMATGEISAGLALLARLKRLGVDYLFANAGTDFPPIIEALAAARRHGLELPEALAIPHENAAMGMAHGYYYATGRAQAVMLHTNVGLANGVIGAINAATDNVPILMMSGRTPVTEQDRFGARTVPIGWGQEMRDQTALVREVTKWDYELRFPEQVRSLLDRAHAIAHSTPKGPVYLALPREVLAEACPDPALDAAPTMRPAIAAPSPADLAVAARLLAGAERPLIIAQRGAGTAETFAAFAHWVEDWAFPVSQYWAVQLALAGDHPMQIGSDPGPWLEQADVVLVIDALAPWWPDRHKLAPGATVIQLGPDPLQSRFPVRNFPSEIALVGETGPALEALIAAMAPLQPADPGRIEARRWAIAKRSQVTREAVIAAAHQGRGAPMSKGWISHCLGRALRGGAAAGQRATVLSELGCPLDQLALEQHDSWYQEPQSGGLGWSLPTAMGIQLADPERLVIATMGDGAYMFANPSACHQVAEALGLPVVILVLNNGEWGAVRRSVAGLYPKGEAMAANRMPLTALAPSPDFVKTAEASRAYGEDVTEGEALPAALERAIKIATGERRPALLNIRTAPSPAGGP